MKTILITGAAGFIANHLATRLLNEGNAVIGVDNFVTGSSENVDRLNDVAANSEGSFEFHEFDISDESIVGFLDERYEGINQIYNLACPASPKDFASLGIDILDVCSRGTANMLELARRKNARFVQGSTSEVYGDPLESPQSETYFGNVNTLGSRSCYDEGKRFAESYIFNFSKKHNVDFRIARIFNTYGEYMAKDDGRVIPNFIEQLKNNEPITIYGGGLQTRSFCYVSDMVDGLKLLMEYEGFDENIKQNEPIKRVFNLGNPHEIPIIELAKTLANLIGKELNTQAITLPQDDPKRRCPVIEKAKNQLGFQPKISLEEGLKKTLANWE